MEQAARDISGLLINHLDNKARDNVIKLDQKLKGLRAEVDVRIQFSSSAEVDDLDDYKERLSQVIREIDGILGGLDVLIQMTADDPKQLDAFVQSEEMHQFNDLISSYLEKVVSLQKQF